MYYGIHNLVIEKAPIVQFQNTPKYVGAKIIKKVFNNEAKRPKKKDMFHDRTAIKATSASCWEETGEQAAIELQVVRLHLYPALAGFSSVAKSQQSSQNNFQEKTI